jgi:glycosyltransferase involved in cell wall biosynthesis
MAHSDVHIYLPRASPGLEDRVRELKELKPGRIPPYGEIAHPPKIFWSIDDNYHWVHPLNPSFIANGYRLPDGRILGKEDVAIETEPGKHQMVWRYEKRYDDGVFDPIQNRRDIQQMDEFLKTHAEGVYFTTKRLEKFYRDEVGYPNTYVYPNCVMFEDYQNLDREGRFVRNDPSRVRVLWQGGSSHFQDLVTVRKSLIELVKQEPKIQFVMWGTRFNWIERELPDDNFQYIPWMPYEAYKPLMGILDYDFAIAPLVDGTFNRGKSGIKVYESAVLPRPKPVLAANVPPYSDEFEDGVTAMLFEPRDSKEFEDKFMQLAKDPELRDRIAKNCKEWVREYRNAETEAPKLFDWIAESRGPRKTVEGKLRKLRETVEVA